MHIAHVKSSLYTQIDQKEKPPVPAPLKIDYPVVLEYAKKHFPKEGILRIMKDGYNSGFISIEFPQEEIQMVLTHMASDLKDFFQDPNIEPDEEKMILTDAKFISPEGLKKFLPLKDQKVRITILDMHREVGDSPHWLSVNYFLQIRSPEIGDITFMIPVAWWWWQDPEPYFDPSIDPD